MHFCAFLPFYFSYYFRQFHSLHRLFIYHINYIAVPQTGLFRRSPFKNSADISHTRLGVHSYICADPIIDPFRLLHQIFQIFLRIISGIWIPQSCYDSLVHAVNHVFGADVFLVIIFGNRLFNYLKLIHRNVTDKTFRFAFLFAPRNIIHTHPVKVAKLLHRIHTA